MNPHRAFSERFPKTLAVLDSAKLSGIFPSYSVGVLQDDQLWFAYQGCGQQSLYDLASLTKVLCTTTVTLLAESRNILSIDDPVQKYFPNFTDSRVSLSHLLDHSSGFSAWLDLHSRFHAANGLGQFNSRLTPKLARIEYEREILASFNPKAFEQQTIYSDLGFMLLGWALEKATGAPLDALFQEWVLQPTGLKSLQFLPISPDVVPTENCPWRGHVLRGEVHDDNCYVLGGVAGHAGLFGTALEVVRLAQFWLEALGGKPGNPLFSSTESQKRAHHYWTFHHLSGASRALGWDGLSREGSSAGKYFSPQTRGHLGYTGTSLWVDPERKLIVTLLTNRVHPTRSNEKIKAFRPVFHDTLLTELGMVLDSTPIWD